MRADSAPAAVFHEWEYQIQRHLHGYKVKDEQMRLTLAAPFLFDDFIYGQIDQWKDDIKAQHHMCIMFGEEKRD